MFFRGNNKITVYKETNFYLTIMNNYIFYKLSMKSLVPKKDWGNLLWKYIHNICIIDLETPEENAKETTKIIKILKNIKNIIPCISCKKEWKQYLKTLDDIDIYKRLSLFYWSWEIHNKVNIRLHKPLITYENALNIYTKEK